MLEDGTLRLEGIQHVTEEEWRTSTSSSRANEVVGPKLEGCSAVDAPGSERKVWCCKEKYCIGKAVLGYSLKNDRMIWIKIQGRPSNITVIQVYAPTTHAEEAEIDHFYEDLQHLLELTPKKDILLILVDWNAKARSQEIKGTTSKFGPGVQNEIGQRLIEFCQENKLVITNTLFQQHKRWLYTWT